MYGPGLSLPGSDSRPHTALIECKRPPLPPQLHTSALCFTRAHKKERAAGSLGLVEKKRQRSGNVQLYRVQAPGGVRVCTERKDTREEGVTEKRETRIVPTVERDGAFQKTYGAVESVRVYAAVAISLQLSAYPNMRWLPADVFIRSRGVWCA